MQRIAIVGSGHLAHALWEGWRRNPDPQRTFVLVARSDAHRDLWDSTEWGSMVSYDPAAIRGSAMVVLAVKPKDAQETVARIAPYLDGAVLVSPVAGWTIAQFRELAVQGPLVRIMPNVCAAIGASTTLAVFDRVSDQERQAVEALLNDCGSLTVVEESLINPYTALVGSGPAYIFLLLEALIEGGRQLGTDVDRTRELVSSMVEGAARLARDRSQDTLSEWIKQVASPGGTTEASLAVLNQAGWPALLREAVVAASQRAVQLGKPT